MSAAEDRSTHIPGATYQQLLDADSRDVPAHMRTQTDPQFGDGDIPVRYYLDPAIAELERDRIWTRCWLMACREEVLTEVGATEVFNVAGLSFLLVRVDEDTIAAYYNACLHRGRQLVDGRRPLHELRCPFHGFCWSLDGELKDVPSRWDFPQIDDESFRLPSVQVDTWGGFVFINADPDAPPLREHLGVLPEHFERWRMEERYTQVHVRKVLPCNWKVAQEAFMESFHVITTHPQLLEGMGDADSQYDAFDNVSRAMTPRGTPSPHLNYHVTEQETFDSMMGLGLDDAPVYELPDDTSARRVVADAARRRLAADIGEAEADPISDAELIDSFYYTLFPNFHPWGGFNRICYRFLPHGDDPARCTMEVMMLGLSSGDRPPPAEIVELGIDDSFIDAADHLDVLARVFFQDEFNVGFVQNGMRTLQRHKPGLTFGVYQETKIRHFYQLYRQAMGLPEDETA